MTNTITTVCFAFLLAISAPVCRAEDQSPSEALSSIKKLCPEALRQPMVVATGDLNGDRFPDVAAIVSCKSTEYGEPQDEELIVLYGQQGGFYKIAYRSEVWPWNGRSEMELNTKNKVLVLSEHCAYNCNPESWASAYKFKMRQNKLILAGEDHSQTTMSGKDLEFEEASGSSVNYLTQKVIYREKKQRDWDTPRRSFLLISKPQFCCPISTLKPAK